MNDARADDESSKFYQNNPPLPRTVVVKYGGAAMQSDALKALVCADAAALLRAGVRLALVHGGGPELSAFLRAQGKEPRFVDGLRYTDEDTIDAAVMVLAGRVNKELSAMIARAGGRAVGLCGIDGAMFSAERKTAPDLGLVGEVTRVDTALPLALMEQGFIPVVASLGIAAEAAGGAGTGAMNRAPTADAAPVIYNINADTAAAALAGALAADVFVTLSDIPGVLRNPPDETSLIAEIWLAEVEAMIADGVISGGMIPKIRGCADAIRAGARAVRIVDGRVPHALLRAVSGADGTAIRSC